MPRAEAASAMARVAASLMRAPVGFVGEFNTIARVRGVRAAITASGCSSKPSSGCVRTSTGEAPASLICSGIVGQHGACVITSSPGLKSASAALKSDCLPPAVMRISPGVMRTP